MVLQTLFLAFVISLVGSIPPGSINVTVMRLGMLKKQREAYMVAVGATFVEWIYVLVVIRLQLAITEHMESKYYLTLITAIVMLVLSGHAFFSQSKAATVKESKRKGLLKGLLLGFVNPLAIPFWLSVSTYLQVNSLVVLSGFAGGAFGIGVVLGSLVTLYFAASLGKKFAAISHNDWVVRIVPGFLFLSMALWNFYHLAS